MCATYVRPTALGDRRKRLHYGRCGDRTRCQDCAGSLTVVMSHTGTGRPECTQSVEQEMSFGTSPKPGKASMEVRVLIFGYDFARAGSLVQTRRAKHRWICTVIHCVFSEDRAGNARIAFGPYCGHANSTLLSIPALQRIPPSAQTHAATRNSGPEARKSIPQTLSCLLSAKGSKWQSTCH